MRVVVTGGAGFIGTNVCRAFVADGHDVVVLDDLSTGRKENLDALAGSVALLEGSILDRALLDEVFDGAGAVVHLAARGSVPRSIDDPMATHTANATGTLEVLEAARRNGSPHVIVASSSSVYGANPRLPRVEDDQLVPVSPYAVSKVATEQYALAHQQVFGVPVLAFRFFNVFGPHQPAGHAYAAVVPAFVEAALAGRPLPFQGDGTQTRDFTFVETVADVILDGVRRQVTSDLPVNLAFGTRVSLLELADLLDQIIGTPLERAFGEPRAGDVRDSQADQTRLRAFFPDVRPVDLEPGLRATVDWFRSTL